MPIPEDFTPEEISKWNELLGNGALKVHLLNFMRHDGVAPKIFLAGPSRSGKSNLIHHACRLMNIIENGE